jgi:hypothetical protein
MRKGTITRRQAVDILNRFIKLDWDYSDEFDQAFHKQFDDELLDSIATEFREIQWRYEAYAETKNRAICEDDLRHLNELIAKLRSAGDET